MAGRSNTVTINILGDSTSALRALNEVDRESSRIGGAIAGAGKAMAGGLALAGGAFVGLTASAVGMGLKTAASMETAKIGFETMLGSAQKADKFLGELQKFAASTPFEFPELQSAASSLISVGVQTDKVIPIMKTLGNVTSGMGTGAEGVQRATVALQQMSAAGRITGEDLNQLRDAGIPVFDLLAAATGKSKEEVAALAQAGKLGKTEMDQLFKALETGKGLERFNGLMEKQSQSLSGLFSTLKDTVSMGLANAVQPLVPLLSKAIPIAAALSGAALEHFTGFLERLVQVARTLWSQFRSGEADIYTLAENIDYLLGSTGLVAPVIMEVGAVAKDLWTVFRDGLLPVIVDFYTAMPSFLTPLGLARDVLRFVAEHAEALQPIMAALLGGFLAFKVVTGILQAVAVAQGLLNVVMTANPIGILVVAIAGLVAGLVWAYNNVSWFREGVQNAFANLAASAKWLGGVFVAIWDGIVAGFRWVRDTLRSIANWIAQNVINPVIDGVNLLIRGRNALSPGDDMKMIALLPSFHSGGVVPGPRGADVPIMAQAGETVLPAGARGMGSTIVEVNFHHPLTSRDQADYVVGRLEDFFSRGGSIGNGKGGVLAPS